jgi:hypothetical protein
MHRWSSLLLTPIVAGLSACTPPFSSVPEPVAPSAPVQYYDLDIPSDLEIKAVDFAATAFLDVSGVNGQTSSSTAARGFIKVYAVQRGSGEQFLLLYEDVTRRKRPIQVIHFRSTPDVVQPGG